MPLGDVQPFYDWIERNDPVYRRARPVESWLIQVGQAPYRAPSEPIDWMSNRPLYEVRSAEVSDPPVWVLYRRTYATETVDLIWVGEVLL
jgi:hypothetical protein